MPKENLGLLNDHSTLQSQQNILQLVELSVIDITDEGFVVSDYQPSVHKHQILIKIMGEN